MSADLERAFAALRETPTSDPERAAKTRARLLLAAKKAPARAKRVVGLALPLAAAFVVSTVWAAATHRLPGQSREGRDGIELAPPKLAPRPRLVVPVPPAPAPRPEEPAMTIDELPAAAPSPPRAPSASPAGSVAPKPPPGPTAEESAYQRAHELHFTARDMTSALFAWERYLASYPDGRFAPEAAYNRAVALVHLRRFDEAKRALAPFADAPPGSYRREEARTILDALRTR